MSTNASNRNQLASDRRAWILEWQRLKWHLRRLRKWYLRPHRPYQPLFIIATPRSGSTLLLSYLNQQPDVAMNGELLNAGLPIGPRRDCLPPAKAIRHIRFCLQEKKAPIRGCKLFFDHLANCRLHMDQLNEAFPQARYIILYRESLAEQFISLQLAIATSQWVLHPNQDRRQAELVVKPSELRAYCDEVRREYRELLDCQWLAGRSVLLSYEELTADPGWWFRDQICPLLNVPFVAPQARLCKQNNRPLARQVSNYREVAELLHGPLCRQHHHWPGQRNGSRIAV